MVEVNPAGLRSLAVSCTAWTCELSDSAVAPPLTGLPCQATTGALNIVRTDLATVRETLIVRLRTTAAKLAAAAADYDDRETTSASELSAVAESLAL